MPTFNRATMPDFGFAQHATAAAAHDRSRSLVPTARPERVP
jgi:hypothetical protein